MQISTQQKTKYRLAAGVAVFAALLILWVNLAVGIIGEPDDLANLMYVGVIAIGLLGGTLSRFRPTGMVRNLHAMAFAQVLVALITLIFRLGHPPTPPLSLLVFNLILIACWVGSARLFQHAIRK